MGIFLYGALAFAAGAVPWALPALYLAFALVCLPWRLVQFTRKKWTFFLLDFCYFANIAAVANLVVLPNHVPLHATLYALTDGPLAAALIVWQCAWVFGSADHTISVLIHLLPGLAMFAYRHYPTPQGYWFSHLPFFKGGREPYLDQGRLQWLVLAPMMFYLCWQLMYFLVVQVALRSWILKHKYDTSYSCLARRAAKTNNFWNRLVRRGSPLRRCFMYGLIQLAFTFLSLVWVNAIYHSFALGCVWQVLKVGIPLYYGSQYQWQKVPHDTFLSGVNKLAAMTAHGQERELMPVVQLRANLPVDHEFGGNSGGKEEKIQ